MAYQQIGHLEGGENNEDDATKWHFEQFKKYVNAFDMAYHQIVHLEGGENNEDDATTKGKMKQIKDENKSIEIIIKGKYILANIDIINKYDDDEIMPLSKF
jgi:hypothetical protein